MIVVIIMVLPASIVMSLSYSTNSNKSHLFRRTNRRKGFKHAAIRDNKIASQKRKGKEIVNGQEKRNEDGHMSSLQTGPISVSPTDLEISETTMKVKQ
jgi:hypothetical protein